MKTKIAIAALIDEYEKLRQPLLVAVKEEVAEREKELLAATLERQPEQEQEDSVCEGEAVEAVADVEVRKDNEGDELEAVVEAHENGSDAQEAQPDVSAQESQEMPAGEEENKESSLRENEGSANEKAVFSEGEVSDLLKLLYFAHLFDVRSQGEAASLVWTRVHERSSCLSYDFVTDDSTTPLIEGDLDALSLFGSMLTSRPPNETLSHRDALQRCIEHAREWLLDSDRLIQLDSNISCILPQSAILI